MAADAGTDTAATACTGDVDFFKFPRTHHIADAGGSGVTRDDLVMSSGDAEQFLAKGSATVSVEEKVDGANLGFSVDPTTQQLMMQNRGHFVNEETAAQWSGLKEWLQVHRFELYDVLQPAGRHILFGEWCYAVHSLEYKALSDTFLAFDVYDREEGCFYSIKRRNEFLAETSIRTVPLIRSSTFRTVAELLPLLDTPSAFRGDGEPVEGARSLFAQILCKA
ncbi:unnamed protein product [Symbiodinium sp. KB8]|nr:unnamed protein product [Symbiodinium sp. KB8]